MGSYAQTIAGLAMNGGTIDTGSTTLTLNGNATIDTYSSTATITGKLDLNAGTRTFTVADSTASTDLLVTAVISNGGLTMTGDGTMVFAGEDSCTGDITLTAGTLRVDGTLASATLLVAGGTLQGLGTVGTVSATAGTINPQASQGALSGTALTATSGTTFSFDIETGNGELPAGSLLDLDATATLGSALLVIDTDLTYGAGDTVVLLSAAGGISGTFSNASDGSIVLATSGQQFRIHITDTQVTAAAIVVLASTPGAYDASTSTFTLRYENSSGDADTTFAYGLAEAGWIAVVGDWDGDGTDTVGLYEATTANWYLRNENSGGVADVSFGYGAPGSAWTPVTGDWTASGTDTIGLYDADTATWFLRDSNTSGPANYEFTFGTAGNDVQALRGAWTEPLNAAAVDALDLAALADEALAGL
jgi:autotransporter-associated beta strand protein